MPKSKVSVTERPPAFVYRRGTLHCENAAIPALAGKHGTPLYVYSATTIQRRYRAFDDAFRRVPHTVCYSVKANSNLSMLRMLGEMGCGFDVVSGGELERVRRASKKALGTVVFSGVGKTREEMDAALRAGILMFNVESEEELAVLAECATRRKKRARIALRVNPDVPADTHPYISTGLHQHKFGIPIGSAQRLYETAAQQPWIDVAGVSVHIGSQITDLKPFRAAMERVAELVAELKAGGHDIRYVDAGGGLGIRYEGDSGDDFAARAKAYATAVSQPLRGVHLLLEPGRSIVGPAGALVTRVLYVKRNNGKRFVVVDAAMNDLIRPALYGAHHEIVPAEAGGTRRSAVGESDEGSGMYDVVGPVCETGDFFARDRKLPEVSAGELLAILDAGAYGMSIASNYNTRPRAAEVLVEGRKTRVIRRREKLEDLYRGEV